MSSNSYTSISESQSSLSSSLSSPDSSYSSSSSSSYLPLYNTPNVYSLELDINQERRLANYYNTYVEMKRRYYDQNSNFSDY